jgi:hypothetical protein
MVCWGAGRREEARGVLGVAWDPIVTMLTVVGVAPALVVGGKRGRRKKGEDSLGRPLALGFSFGLGRLGLAKERRGERQLGRLHCWAGREKRGRVKKVFLFYFLKRIKC